MFERCLYFNSQSLARSVNALWEQAYAEVGLSPAHAYLVRLVLDQPGLLQKQIAEELNLEKSTVTRFLDSLQLQELIRRKKEGREQTVWPTAKAKRMHSQLQQIGDALYGKMQRLLGSGDMRALVQDMRKARDKLA